MLKYYRIECRPESTFEWIEDCDFDDDSDLALLVNRATRRMRENLLGISSAMKTHGRLYAMRVVDEDTGITVFSTEWIKEFLV